MRSPVGSAAGLAGDDAGVAALLKPVGQAADLGGFARAVEPFKRDELSARHGQSLPLCT